MRECGHRRSELVGLLREELPPERRRPLLEHVESCEACAAELEALARAWEQLPAREEARPPAGLRERVLTYARDAVAEPAGVVGGLREGLWRAIRPVALPAAAGVLAAAAVVVALEVGHGLAVERHIPVLALGLALAALVSGAVGGLWAAASRRTVRAVLLGGLGSLAGYLLLSLLHPIPSTVEFCQLRIFRDPGMSLGQVCLVYAGVSALYAGLPVAAAAWWSAPPEDGWKVGLAEGMVFTLLALPVLGLQFGMEEVAITATVLAGVALGATVGGVAGALAREPRRPVGAGG